MSATLANHQHGKSRVRLGRVWRKGPGKLKRMQKRPHIKPLLLFKSAITPFIFYKPNLNSFQLTPITTPAVHYFVEFTVYAMLESDMAHAFLTESNRGMTATDTQKNMVYVIAKSLTEPCTPEQFALALAKKFVNEYPLVSKAKVTVEMAPWRRLDVNGQPHDHGYLMSGTEIRTAYVTYDNKDNTEIVPGVKDLKVLKTTQSGYVGFLHDKYTALPDVTDRIVATSVTATWKYSRPPRDYDAAFNETKAALLSQFYGPTKGGVYSPSVQFTLFQMGKAAIER